MSCPVEYAELTCSQSGVAFTAAPLRPGDSSAILQTGHIAGLPDITAGKWYYVSIYDACSGACTTVKVTGYDGNTLIFETPVQDCFRSNSRVKYRSDTIAAITAMAKGVVPEFISPLVYDCDNNRVTIDCAAMKILLANNCDG